MIVGKLDQVIQLLSLSENNSQGDLEQSYEDEGNVFAQVISQKGREAFEAKRTNSRSLIRVGMHYRTDVNNTWRLVWESNTYNIVDTDRSDRRDGLLWVTAEAVGAI